LVGIWQSKFYDLSAYVGSDVRISFHITTQYEYSIFLDNFVVGSASSMQAGWAGFTSTAYSNAQNWYSGTVPTGDVTLNLNTDSAANSPSIATDVSTSSLTVDTGVSLTISKTGSLQTTGDFTNNGIVTLNSDNNEFSSIVVGGSIIGSGSNDITYNRYVNTVGTDSSTLEWDLIGSPVSGQSIDSFITANAGVLASGGGSGSDQYAIGVYDNATDNWTNYTAATVAGDFTLGQGYQMATVSGASLAFKGGIVTSQTQSVINNDVSGRRWNLVSNPFPSYIHLNDNNDATNNFLFVNSSVIDANYAAVYGYDADGTGYTIYNNANTSPSDMIAPGQGFFIAAESSSATNISFTKAMRTTSGGDDFATQRLAQSDWSSFYLRLYEDESFASETQFYFEDGLSLGLDLRYDAGAMGENDLMSRLVDEDQGIGMAINAMGNDFDDTRVPLVMSRDAGVEFSISLEDSNIPEDINIYLEDTLLETYTDLRSGDFTLTPDSDLSDMGRFYIIIGDARLGGDDLEASYISIYKAASDDFVTIEGLLNVEIANVQLFNIIGQEILNTTLQSNQSTQKVPTVGLTKGVYILRLEADSSVISKKIIIN
jgi:hypothetical protein